MASTYMTLAIPSMGVQVYYIVVYYSTTTTLVCRHYSHTGSALRKRQLGIGSRIDTLCSRTIGLLKLTKLQVLLKYKYIIVLLPTARVCIICT